MFGGKGVSTVAPADLEAYPEERRGVYGWIRRHPVTASVVITLCILGIIAAIVVPVTCSVHGCPPKKAEAPRLSLYDGAPFRLVVAFQSDVDVADLIPPILKPYTSRIMMVLSNLQVLEAQSESVLELVLSEIQNRTDIEYLVRDFILTAPEVLDAVSQASGRRLQQTYNLNDSGLSAAWWFDRINVTGAWQLLGISNTDPQRQTSDVTVGVIDSGALVTHPDLAGAFWENPDEVDDDLIDNDENGFIDDVYGASFSTSQCSPTYSGNNVSLCGIGRNTSLWNGITDRFNHGTKIAGIIGAAPNNGIGLAGVAPNLRQMILKVTDETRNPANPPYAFSDVVRAVDYAYGKGARIFSMSFGNNARSMTSIMRPDLDAAAAAYRTLFNKYNNALFVAASGNEWSNLDDWRAANYTYSPCTVGTPNTLCVGATNSNDSMFYAFVRNKESGTNWGLATVDMVGPGQDIYTTDLEANGWYNSVSGTSYATPMVAAVAGLVLTALGGQARATSQTPLHIKNILMTSGDMLEALQTRFRSARRLNAGNAVAAALTMAATNRTVLKPARNISDVSPAVAMQAWEYYWFTSNGSLAGDRFDAFGPAWTFIDHYVRSGQPTSNFNVLRYGTNSLGLVTAMVRIDTPGLMSIQARTSLLAADTWQVTLGENVLVWNTVDSSTSNTDVIFPTAGYYNMTLRVYPNWGSTINFLWMLPGSNTWTSPAIFWILHEDPPTSRYYDPVGLTPKPALWHVVWNETASFDFNNRGYFTVNKDPRLYRTWQTTVPDFNFATGADLRNALYGPGGGTNTSIVYGYARANLRPQTFTTGISFRLQGNHIRLFINDQNILDFVAGSTIQLVSPCLTLSSNIAHEIYVYFAASAGNSNIPTGVTWATCTGAAGTPGTQAGAYSSFSSSLATNFWWQATNTASLPRGFRCDAWPGNRSINSFGTTPAFGTIDPVLTWVYPRDCPAALRTSNGECRMATRLIDLFPDLTWNVWSIRCYTYYAGSILRGTAGATNLNGVIFQHLAGVRVYEQWADGLNSYNYAPINIRLTANLYQLYVIEWVAYAQQWNLFSSLTVWDGMASNVLTTNSTTMILPGGANATKAWSDVKSA